MTAFNEREHAMMWGIYSELEKLNSALQRMLELMESQEERAKGHALPQLGPETLRLLLDLVGRLGKALKNTSCKYKHPECKALYPENPGRWCFRCRGLEYYQQAGGE